MCNDFKVRRFRPIPFWKLLEKVCPGTCEFQWSMVGQHFDRINFIIPDIDDDVLARDGASPA
jgi:hypothetical protein